MLARSVDVRANRDGRTGLLLQRTAATAAMALMDAGLTTVAQNAAVPRRSVDLRVTGPLLQRTPKGAAKALKSADYKKISLAQLTQWLAKTTGKGADRKSNAAIYNVTKEDYGAISEELAALFVKEATAAAAKRTRETVVATPTLDVATRAAQLMTTYNDRTIGPFPNQGAKVADAKATCYYEAGGRYCITPDRDGHAGPDAWKLYQAVATRKGKNDGWMRVDTLHADGTAMDRG